MRRSITSEQVGLIGARCQEYHSGQFVTWLVCQTCGSSGLSSLCRSVCNSCKWLIMSVPLLTLFVIRLVADNFPHFLLLKFLNLSRSPAQSLLLLNNGCWVCIRSPVIKVPVQAPIYDRYFSWHKSYWAEDLISKRETLRNHSRTASGKKPHSLRVFSTSNISLRAKRD